MFDSVITGGTVVDGTGAPGQPADIGIRHGQIAAIGNAGSLAGEKASQIIDADGLIVAPGFVDIHTHYDAQVFWDRACTPSPLHGFTTVIAGNCGFTLAPLEPAESDYLLTMLARVEGMPPESLRAGVPWNWRTTAEYLDCLEGTLAVNAGFLVGHSTLRRVVMGERANAEEATEADVQSMCRLLSDGIAAGGLGFSSSMAEPHHDAAGNPVPSRFAGIGEILALCQVVRNSAGTTIEFVPTARAFDEFHYDLMTRMSLAADRPLNWNFLTVTKGDDEEVNRRLAATDYAAARGAVVLALTLPDRADFRFNFRSGVGIDALPDWAATMALPIDQRLNALADPSVRARLEAGAKQASGSLASVAVWDDITICETFTTETKRYEGRKTGEVAAELGRTPFDALCDILVADELRTVLMREVMSDDDETWARRAQIWRDPRTILGGSDAGAHLDGLATFCYATALLGQGVRERGLMGLEEAIHHITDVPARLYGLAGRGRIADGWCADIVVFDPHEISPGDIHTREDLPGGAGRLFATARGIEHVFVNGTEIVRGPDLTGATPGTILRAGRDTDSTALSTLPTGVAK